MDRKHYASGERFGRLVLIARVAAQKWRCLCDCGATKDVIIGNMTSGRTTSCGCAHSEEMTSRQTIHGGRNKAEYGVWANMKHRCSNPGNTMFYRYGGRGISVCARWSESFADFYSDMGPRPSPKHSIERNDNNGNYEPGNCRWATKIEQGANMSRNKLVEVNGERLIQSEAARRLGLTVSGFRYRLQKAQAQGVPL